MPALHILVVEDHPSSNRVLVDLLRKYGHIVTSAQTGQEALYGAKRKLFDLAIIDIGLPDEDGWILLAKLRDLIPNLPGIAVTGFGSAADVAKSRAAGFAAHLTKPLEFSVIQKEIARIFSWDMGIAPQQDVSFRSVSPFPTEKV